VPGTINFTVPGTGVFTNGAAAARLPRRAEAGVSTGMQIGLDTLLGTVNS
jgi:hypothetical protein